MDFPWTPESYSMLKFSQDRLHQLALATYSERLWQLMRDRVRLPRAVSQQEVEEAVFSCEAKARTTGFASELDLGLYVVAHFCFAGHAQNGDLDRVVTNGSLSNDEKRYRLSAALAEAGFMDFGALESTATQEQIRLWRAIESDEPEKVKEAIAAGGRVNEDGENAVHPLVLALTQGKKNALRELLRNGANPNKRMETGESAVTLAARLAVTDLDPLKIVLDHRGNPDTCEPNGDPILMRLVAAGSGNGIRLLAAKGANLNARDRSNRMGILIAASFELWDLVCILIELGADWRTSQQDLARVAYDSSVAREDPAYVWLEKTIRLLREPGTSFPG